MTKNIKFLDCLDNHKYRYIDSTGNNRPPVSSNVVRPDLNLAGYEAYMTVNGFADCNDNTKDKCTNINAFFCDIDDRKDLAEIEKIKAKLEPSFVIETKRGYHLYWLLDEVIYKSEVENWDEIVSVWERIEQNIVEELNADKAVKDITRIMRQVDTFYWKKSGDDYKTGTEGVFKIKGIHKNLACRYSLEQMQEAFPTKEKTMSLSNTPTSEKAKKQAEAEKENFYQRVNDEFPIEERDSFKRLISAHPESLPIPNCRN
jgi:hypothetical protein